MVGPGRDMPGRSVPPRYRPVCLRVLLVPRRSWDAEAAWRAAHHPGVGTAIGCRFKRLLLAHIVLQRIQRN